MTTHTPGPWRIGPTKSRGGDSQTLTILSGTGATRWGVCNIMVERSQDHDQQSANARLIAAAPDMLAALHAAETQLAEVVDSYSPGTIPENATTCQPFTGALATVRAAIARAEGREG